MRALMRSLAPTSFDDVGALVALYRPGRWRQHALRLRRPQERPQAIEYFHADAEELLADTYGLMIYQETVMRVAQKFAGYSLAEADNLRKACLPAGTTMLTAATRLRADRAGDGARATGGVQTIDTTSFVSRHERVDDVWPVGVKPVYRLTTVDRLHDRGDGRAPVPRRGRVDARWRTIRARRSRRRRRAHVHATADAKVTDGRGRPGRAADLRGLHARSHRPAPVARPLLQHRPRAAGDVSPGVRSDLRPAAPRSGRARAGVTRLRLSATELVELAAGLGPFGTGRRQGDPRAIRQRAARRKVERFLGLYFCADGWADRAGVALRLQERAGRAGRSSGCCCASGSRRNCPHREIGGHGRHWTLSVADKGDGEARSHGRRAAPHRRQVLKVVGGSATGSNEGASATDIGIPTVVRRRASSSGARRDRPDERAARRRHGGGHSPRARSTAERSTGSRTPSASRICAPATCSGTRSSRSSTSATPSASTSEMANDDRPYAVVEDFLVHNCGKKIARADRQGAGQVRRGV